MFTLRFPIRSINEFAGRYASQEDIRIERDIVPPVKARGFLTGPEFLEICQWKTPRSKSRCARNSNRVIEEATAMALSARDESLKIGVLRLLHGVDWPTASVILHFCAAEPYPILDFRALWSLGFERTPPYTNELWIAYTQFTRELVRKARCGIRVLDRALWQYSNENQRKGQAI